MSIEALKGRVYSFVRSRGYRPLTIKSLADVLDVRDNAISDFRAALDSLVAEGRVIVGKRELISLPGLAGKVSGTYRGNERGFGFIIPDTPVAEGDLFVPVGKSGGAITGDRVSAKVLKRGQRKGKMVYEGRVTAVLERCHRRVVGELRRQSRKWFVVPDGNTLHVPIHVDDPSAKNARPGDQVSVEMTQYPVGNQEARGVILRVLGPRGEPKVETLSIIEQYGLPGEFNKRVLRNASHAIEQFDPKSQARDREDLRSLTIITIDPVDARDFDDAISLEKKSDGSMELGVHIADVAFFVQPGSALDLEARERSNSVYLPGTVIPMLPEVLSNGVCSLQEKQKRLTKSVFLTFGRRGQVKKSRMANTVIKSAKRLTYEQAGSILEGKPGRSSPKVVELLKRMEKLAKVIRRRRVREGMLELDLPEVDLIHNEDGKVVGVQPTDDGFTHKIIEMFMVEANEAVARMLAASEVPALRRVHAEPRDLANGDLRRFLQSLGQELPERADRFDLQAILAAAADTPKAFPVHLAVLRSMRQAEYAPVHLGHYALASEHYCHFTSPIRRYPDLTIHRLLDAYVHGDFEDPKKIDALPGTAELEELGRLCVENERRAEAAGRELRQVLLLRLLEERHMGDELDGIVTGVANYGVFVQLERFLIDGLLRFEQLPEDWWEVASNRAVVVAERSGRRITVGDRMSVKIARVHLPTRQLDLALAGPLVGGVAADRVRNRRGQGRRIAPRTARTAASKSGRRRKTGSKRHGRR